jgi:hypothetical protein
MGSHFRWAQAAFRPLPALIPVNVTNHALLADIPLGHLAESRDWEVDKFWSKTFSIGRVFASYRATGCLKLETTGVISKYR